MKFKITKKTRFDVTKLSSLVAGVQKTILVGGGFPIMIFLTVTFFSILGYAASRSSIEDLSTNIIERRVDEYALTLAQTERQYKLLQLGSIARIESAATGPITEQAWKQYIEIYSTGDNFPDLEYITVSFGSSAENNIVYYTTADKDESKKIIGRLISSLGVSKQALDKAEKTDQIIAESDANGPLFLVKAFYDSIPVGKERQSNSSYLRGYTLARIDQQKLFGAIFRQERLIQSKIQIYLGEKKDSNMLYQSDNRQRKDLVVPARTQKIEFFDNELNVVYEFDKSHVLPWYATYFPVLILTSGIFFGLIFSMLAGRLMSRRYTAINIQKEKDIALAQDELLSLASHQLRTPATGVKQYLGMVLQGFAGKLSPKQRLYLERAYASNDRQLGVINDILHVAKLSSGRMVLTERQFDITKLIREVIEEHTRDINKASLNLSSSMPSRGLIFADSHMLRMVFENILSNAVKYTPAGGLIKISVKSRHDHWLIVFTDTGVGIAKQDIPKLFKQFSRIKNPLTNEVPGTGVGLYLAYHLTELHGGWIKVTSKPQMGTSFTICLPKNSRKKK